MIEMTDESNDFTGWCHKCNRLITIMNFKCTGCGTAYLTEPYEADRSIEN